MIPRDTYQVFISFVSELRRHFSPPTQGMSVGIPTKDRKKLSFFDPRPSDVEAVLSPYGWDVVPLTSDLRLWSPAKESLDSAWCWQGLEAHPREVQQRILLTYFSALKPRGLLLTACTEKEGESTDEIAALFRQSGFNLKFEARIEGKPGKRVWLSERAG